MESPVTRHLLSKLDEHIKANKEYLQDFVLGNTVTRLKDDIEDLVAMKGQIHALELVKDLKDFLEITEDEIINEEENI